MKSEEEPHGQHQPAPLPPLCWDAWCENILPFVGGKDMVILTHVSKECSRLMRSDDIRKPYVAKISLGRGANKTTLVEKVDAVRVLPFLGKTYMDVYMAATSYKCAKCGGWTGHLNLFLVRPTCGPCFKAWARTQVMIERKAKLQYLLTEEELETIPSITFTYSNYKHPSSTIVLICRAHAKQLAKQRYSNGLKGLEVDREARKQKARKLLEAYEKDKEEAYMARKPRPKCPPECFIFGSDIILENTGYKVRKYYPYVVPWLGYRDKNDPAKVLEGSDGDNWAPFLTCEYCNPQIDRLHQYQIITFPSRAARTQHYKTCPNEDPAFQAWQMSVECGTDYNPPNPHSDDSDSDYEEQFYMDDSYYGSD